MQRPLAIFVFLIFFAAQFGKLVNYTLCRVAAYQHATVQCDCEKQLTGTANTESQQKQPANTGPVSSQDDLYHLHNSTAYSPVCFAIPVATAPVYAEPLYQAYYASIFHPPGIV